MIWLILGVLLGALPGFHPNLLVGLTLQREHLFQIAFGSIFSSIIPALLMIPMSEMAPLLLLGQKETKEGGMQSAIAKFSGGVLFGVLLFIIVFPLYRYFALLKPVFLHLTLPFLIFTSSATLLRSKNFRGAALLFMISGIYGYGILNSGLDTNLVLGAHFSAMFGLAGLATASKIPKQKLMKIRLSFNFSASVVGFIGGLLISFFPAVTPAQAYVVLLLIFGNSARGLWAAGSLASSSLLLSFQSLAYLGKGRMAVVEVVQYFPMDSLLLYSIVAFVLVLIMSKPLIYRVNQINNLREVLLIGVFASIVLLYPSAGPIVLFSFLLGLIPHKFGIERIHLMGSLIIPTLLWYL
ncbi:MAG: hypothetical protein GOV01_02900 [Candidatus Altiarchaeota archaeon]|nr:hypothetical protein [Candidatus Altiarchaeota archaeon]